MCCMICLYVVRLTIKYILLWEGRNVNGKVAAQVFRAGDTGIYILFF